MELVTRLPGLAPQEILDGVWEAVSAHARGGLYEDDRILMVLKARSEPTKIAVRAGCAGGQKIPKRASEIRRVRSREPQCARRAEHAKIPWALARRGKSFRCDDTEARGLLDRR